MVSAYFTDSGRWEEVDERSRSFEWSCGKYKEELVPNRKNTVSEEVCHKSCAGSGTQLMAA
jgi:hypothetical protein